MDTEILCSKAKGTTRVQEIKEIKKALGKIVSKFPELRRKETSR